MGSFYSCVPGRELTYWLTKCSDSVEMLGISRMDFGSAAIIQGSHSGGIQKMNNLRQCI